MKADSQTLVVATATLLAIGLLLWGFHFYQSGWEARPNSSDPAVVGLLRKYAHAQTAFRDHGPGTNGKKQYWRKDIAGLYGTLDKAGKPIGLIEPSLARADAHPVTIMPAELQVSPSKSPADYAGYFFAALLFSGEKLPAPERFAACAYPGNPDAGPWTYIISDSMHIYRKKCPVNTAPQYYPEDPEQEGWEKEPRRP